VIWATAAISGFRTWLTWKNERETFALQRAQAEQLAHLRMRVQSWHAAVEKVQRLSEARSQPVVWEKAPVISEGTLTLAKEERLPLFAGWQIHRMRWEGKTVPLAGLSDVLSLAESAAPPWRLASLRIEADDERGARGRVVLELEKLEKETL